MTSRLNPEATVVAKVALQITTGFIYICKQFCNSLSCSEQCYMSLSLILKNYNM